MENVPTAISLFSGAGGLDIGLEQAGWSIETATDFAPHAMRTLQQSKDARIRIPGRNDTYMARTRLIEADVTELAANDLRPPAAHADWRPDLVVGGPPCQPWSSAGLQKGYADPRGQLIHHYLRLIGELQPNFVIFENVRGLLTARGETHSPGEVLRSIQLDLQDLGYASTVATLNAADFGAAQRRVRVILLATANHNLPDFPAPTHDRFGEHGLPRWRSLNEVLQALGQPEEQDVVRPSGERADALRQLLPGTGLKTAGRVMANRPSGHWGYRQDAFLADLNLPSRTIRAAGTPDWVRVPGDSDMRRLTWQECAALQGFPQSWSFAGTRTQKFQQIGNAVQVDMARAVGTQVREALRAGRSQTPPVTAEWSSKLLERVRYTMAEHTTNGHLRARKTHEESA